jgi:hypothetical protein
MSAEGLEFLRAALAADDPRLTQGSTTTPPPLICVQDWPVEAADAIALTGIPAAGGWGNATVGAIEGHFARCCFEADQRLAEPAACRWFLGWFDDTPRPVVILELLAEVTRALESRAEPVEVTPLYDIGGEG